MNGKSVVIVLVCIVALVARIAGNSLKIVVKYPAENVPNNAALYLRGDTLGLDWKTGIKMTYSAENTWTHDLTFDAKDVGKTLMFKTLVADQAWQAGHNEALVLPNKVMAAVVSYPWFFSTAGKITTIKNVHSNVLNNSRDLDLYTPPSYYENYLKPMTNVLVMHDGQNLFDPRKSFLGIAWMCQDTIDALVGYGLMDEVFILGIYNTADRMDEYTYSYDPTVKAGGKGNEYLDFIEKIVIPRVVENFRIETDVKNLGILGSSLGGLISCYAGWTRPQIYSKAGCMSSSFWWNSQDFNNTILVKDSNPVPQLNGIYLDSGNEGPGKDDLQETIAVREHIASFKNNYKIDQNLFYYLDKGGMHNEKYWGERFHVPMTYLYPPQLLEVQ